MIIYGTTKTSFTNFRISPKFTSSNVTLSKSSFTKQYYGKMYSKKVNIISAFSAKDKHLHAHIKYHWKNTTQTDN